MPERTEYANGVPNWMDLASTDVDAARSFYAGLFGWSFEGGDTPDGGTYYMAMLKDRPVAGLMAQSADMAEQGMPSVWSTYIAVDDLDGTLAKVEPAGGAVMMPALDIPEAGRMAMIADPTGAVVGLWEKDQHVGAGLVNEHGTVCWNELMTPDVGKAAAFFADVLGWGAETADFGGNAYTSFLVDGQGIAGGMKPPMDDIPPFWGFYFDVDDLDATLARAQELGATVLNPPMEVPEVGRMALLADPTGALFSLLQPATPTT